MAWVKKNLFILVTAIVSIGVLAYGFVFVSQKKAADEEVAASLDESAQKFRDLISRKVHPGNEKVDNIKTAREELGKMRSFMNEMREYLKGPTLATNINNQSFRAELDNSVSLLRREAEEAGVALPNTNYWFTFTSYKTTVDFKGEAPALAAELEDIRSIMHIAYAARVHSIVAFKRSPTSDLENMGTTEYMQKMQRTNDWAITTAYEFTFQGFSGELARMMEGLANAKQCFVVKTVGVAQAPEEKKAGPQAPPPMMMMPPAAMSERMRYGSLMQPNRAMMPAIPAPAPRPQITGLKTILDESKLRFTLQVDSIRLKGS